ncbi:GerAB/ArcD/ProY family transporter [Paenibacillus silvae]|jgi:spore germination protein KB|uniref:GerAB/ArcD/ProY family transporter n=1 Tax=Paenibacillus TaxID=44249 RepID=UPI001C0F4B0B|nr:MULTISPECIES: endospore germination permease [Paenibacillus]MBU5355961.1 endospore germination permease [Paenibacillus barcinonensis]MDM5279968.1 endospore germination permease [Paenibacillus silvae]
MLIQEKLTIRQFAVLALLSMIGDMILIYPTMVTYSSHQDAWICSILSQPIGLCILWLIYKLHQTYPTLSLIEICPKILGVWMGSILSAAYLFYFLMGTSICIREVGDFMTTQIYLSTPIRAILLLFVAALTWGMLKGLDSIGKSAEIWIPFVIVGLLVLFIFLLPQAELSRLKPFLNTPFFSMVSSSFRGATISYGELIILSMILPYIKHDSHVRRDMMLSVLLGGALLTSLLLIALLVVGPLLTQHNIYISYILAQKINVGNFFQRIEALTAITWLISTYFKTIIYAFGFVIGTAQLFRLKSYKPLILPSMMLFFAMSVVLAPNIIFYTITVTIAWFDWDLTACTIIPSLLILIHRVKNSFKKRRTRPSADAK